MNTLKLSPLLICYIRLSWTPPQIYIGCCGQTHFLFFQNINDKEKRFIEPTPVDNITKHFFFVSDARLAIGLRGLAPSSLAAWQPGSLAAWQLGSLAAECNVCQYRLIERKVPPSRLYIIRKY